MFKDQKSMKIVFDAAATAIKEEDKLLRSHCSKPCGYHHGVAWVREPILVHLIFRELIKKKELDYDIRLEQPYKSNRRLQADLVLMRDRRWAACVEAKWLDSPKKVDKAVEDMERMKQKLASDVGKFLLTFWVKSPENKANIDPWLKRLESVPAVILHWTEMFETQWYNTHVEEASMQMVEAGITLFEVN